MNLIYYLFRESWKMLLLAVVSSIIGGVAGAALVAIIAKAIAGDASRTMLAWSFFGACLAYMVFMSVSQITLMKLTQAGVLRLRVAMSHKLLATPMAKLQSLGKHGLLVILTRDINTFVDSFPFMPMVFCNGIVVLSCTLYIAWLSWQVLIFFAVIMIVGMFLFYHAQRRPLKKLEVVRAHVQSLFLHFRSLIDGAKELQLNSQRGRLFIDDVIAPKAVEFRDTYIESMSAYTWVVNVGTAMFYILIGVLLFALPVWLPQRAEVLTTVTLVVLYLVRPITELMNALPALRQAGIALKEIQKLDGDLTGRGADRIAENSFGSGRFQLELRGVRHGYASADEDMRFELGPMDLKIGQGEILYIVGGNGSGKTTLAMLLLGLYRPEQGHLTLNGVAVDDSNLEDYRSHFSAVFAEFHLFEQILGTDQEALGRRAQHYVNALGMQHKVKVEGGRFSTLDLSSGQRKRLALVSSYLEDRPVYLFDEWAADQDPRFKRIFYTELLPELKARGKTVIVITHDDAYFAHADRIIKLEDGHLQQMHAQPECAAA
jgi:putative ATP-binding cassette transporter